MPTPARLGGQLLSPLLVGARALGHLVGFALGALGLGRVRLRASDRPQVAFQAYATHLAQFYEPVIRRLQEDGRVDVSFIVLPHPQLPRRERQALRQMAVRRLGIDASRVVSAWRTLWWPLDLLVCVDVLALFPLRKVRTCLLLHGTGPAERGFTRRWPRKSFFDFDLVLPFGNSDRDLIESHREGRHSSTRVQAVGCPHFDALAGSGGSREEYLQRLGLEPGLPIVLLAPHWTDLNRWGPDGPRRLREAVAALFALPVNLVLKPHAMSLVPSVVAGRRWESALHALEGPRVRWETSLDDRDALRHANVLLTGVSSRAFNFMLLDKPIVIFPPAPEPSRPLARMRAALLREAAPVAESIPALVHHVQAALDDPGQRSPTRQRQAQALFANPGRATEATLHVLYTELGLTAGTGETIASREGPRPSALSRAAATVRAAAGDLAIGLGLFVPRSTRSVWLCGDDWRSWAAADGLVRWLHEVLPQHRLLCTTRKRHLLHPLRRLFPNDLILPAPFACRAAVRRFWRAVRPEMLLFLAAPEAIDRQVLRQVSAHRVPAAVLDVTGHNAGRLPAICSHDAGLRASLFYGALDRWAFDALVIHGCPPERIAVVGSLRFARRPAAAADTTYLLRELGIDGSRKLIAAEGVPEGELDLVLAVFASLRPQHPGLLLLIEPQGPRGVRRLHAACRRRGLRAAVAGETGPAQPPTDVIVFPRRGGLSGFYGLACVVLAGGSFREPGPTTHGAEGAASAHRPVLFGPHVGMDAIAHALLGEEAAWQVETAGLPTAIDEILRHPESARAAGARAGQVMSRQSGWLQAAIDALQPLLPEAGDTRRIRQEWRIPSRVEKLGSTSPGQRALRLCRRRRISGWGPLRERLGHPRSILCLGNGPSSEDPRLLAIEHDRLFRVNSTWRGRGFLDRPDVVFVGDMDSVLRLSGCVFAFRNVEWEGYQLLRRLLRGRIRPAEFFTLERLPLAVSPEQWPARPTSGALMLLAAVMLQPARLIVGGIDLFRHADGRYPGDLVSPNAYAQVHDREVDLQFIRACLAHYRGELVMVSDVLREALAGEVPAGAP